MRSLPQWGYRRQLHPPPQRPPSRHHRLCSRWRRLQSTLLLEPTSHITVSKFHTPNLPPLIPSTPLCSAAHWWLDEQHTGRVLPTGHLHLESCFPLNQPISRKQVVNINQVLHTNPSVIYNLTVRADRPDNSPYAAYDGTKVGCISDGIYCAGQMRSALAPAGCMRDGGVVVGNSSMDMGPAVNMGAGSTIDCKWVNPITLDTTRLGESGIVQYRSVLRALVPHDSIYTPGAVPPYSPREIHLIQSAFAGPADLPGLPCTGRWCNWDDPSVHYLSVGAWTTGTNYTVVSFGGGWGWG